MADVDPITLEVVSNAMHSIASDMGVTIWRTAYSTVVRDSRDCSSALFDAQGRLITQADMIPALLGSMQLSLAEMLEQHYPLETLSEGDVILLNHPYMGGTHTPDITIFSPVFWEGEPVAFCGSIAHHIDLGSGQAAGIGIMTNLFQEGVLLPPVKLYEQGDLNESLVKVIRANSRYPDLVMGDLRAQVAANKLGMRRVQELLQKYGRATLASSWSAMMDFSERKIRAEIEQFPDGDYPIVGFLDDDGIEHDQPVRLEVTIRIRGGDIIYDFTGTAPQVKGNANCVPASVAATCYYVTRCITDPEVPENAGCHRPVAMVLPEGTVVNPTFPAACAGKHPTAQKLADLLLRGFASVMPERVVAGSCASTSNYTIVTSHGVQYEMMGGGFGARAAKDGIDAIQVNMSKCVGLLIEEAEMFFPCLIERFELRQDSGGAGAWRGGLGLRRDVRLLTPGVFSISSDTETFAPPGVFGGLDGLPGRKYVNLQTPNERRIHAKTSDLHLAADDVVSVLTPGSGGYGDPLDRDPQLVLADVLDGKVSVTSAERDYAVVIDRQGRTVDVAQTRRLRLERRGSEARLTSRQHESGSGELGVDLRLRDHQAGIG